MLDNCVTNISEPITLKNWNTYSKNENIGEYEISVIRQP